VNNYNYARTIDLVENGVEIEVVTSAKIVEIPTLSD
jgi:hypothetical protein